MVGPQPCGVKGIWVNFDGYLDATRDARRAAWEAKRRQNGRYRTLLARCCVKAAGLAPAPRRRASLLRHLGLEAPPSAHQHDQGDRGGRVAAPGRAGGASLARPPYPAGSYDVVPSYAIAGAILRATVPVITRVAMAFFPG